MVLRQESRDEVRSGAGTRVVVWFAVVLLASGLPASLAVAAGWADGAVVLPPVVLVLLLAAAVAVRALRSLLLVLAASVGGLWAVTVAVGLLGPVLATWPMAVQILVVNGAKVLPLGLAALVVFRYHGPRPEHAALRPGDWRADTGLRLAGRRLDWRWPGTAVALVICGGAALSVSGSVDGSGILTALRWLPVLLVAALINSAAEEFLYRHAVNATLGAWFRPGALIALTSAYFGVTHINGTPNGVGGILLAGAFGLVLASAIAQTRGFCWNWTMHFAADVAIFTTTVALTG